MRRLILLAAVAAFGTAWADSAGGIQWTAPGAWKSQGARPMRAATYVVPAAAPDKEDGECAVFFFGPGQGGGVQANIDRWIGQFQQPDGKASKDAAKIGKQTIQGLPVTTIDLSGTYMAAAGPMAPNKVVKPGYRMLGAIVEGPEGAVFFKLTGPAKTVTAAEPAFQGMLKSLKK